MFYSEGWGYANIYSKSQTIHPSQEQRLIPTSLQLTDPHKSWHGWQFKSPGSNVNGIEAPSSLLTLPSTETLLLTVEDISSKGLCRMFGLHWISRKVHRVRLSFANQKLNVFFFSVLGNMTDLAYGSPMFCNESWFLLTGNKYYEFILKSGIRKSKVMRVNIYFYKCGSGFYKFSIKI